jgi:hypothetical protein
MDPKDTQTPELLDLTIDNITPNTILINNQTKNPRLKYLMERLVTHIHDFARETRLSTNEWMTALSFLIATGQICSDVRNVSRRMWLQLPIDAPIAHTPGYRNSSCCPTSWACPCS